MKKIIYPLFLALLLVACSQREAHIDITTEPANTGVQSEYDEAFLSASEAQLLFKEDQSVAYFAGEGNEYAAFTETTHWLSNQYVEVVIDNGGTMISRYFYVHDDAVYLVKELSDEEPALTLEQLTSLPLGEPIITVPFKMDTQVGEWRITQTDATVTTALQTFTNVTILEKQTINETNKIYLALGFGIVKNEFITTFEGQQEIIRSTLTSIDYN
ncbi:MAG: hypothetical protein ABS948_08675 [Solibacillus sp.]